MRSIHYCWNRAAGTPVQGPVRPLVTNGGPLPDSQQELFLSSTTAVNRFYQTLGSRLLFFKQSPSKSTADRHLASESCSRKTNKTHQVF